jgi:hypothetical protein
MRGVLGGLRGLGGRERLYDTHWQVRPPEGGRLTVLQSGTVPAPHPDVEDLLTRALARAGACVTRANSRGPWPVALRYSLAQGARKVRVDWHPGAGRTEVSKAMLGCVSSAYAGMSLGEPSPSALEGAVRFLLELPARESVGPTTQVVQGWDLDVEVVEPALGTVRVVLGQTTIPPVRLRARPSVVVPGGALEVALLRGPGFHGELPEADAPAELMSSGRVVGTLSFDADRKTFVGVVPHGIEGLLVVRYAHTRALVWVPVRARLAVSIEPARSEVRPGEMVPVRVRTSTGGAPSEAAVLLSGVDEALGQLAPLLAADDFARVTVPTAGVGFGQISAADLFMGRVTGEHAVAATLGALAPPAARSQLSPLAIASPSGEPDATHVLAGGFFRALARARLETAAWEQSTEGLLTPDVGVQLWSAALAALARDGEPALDLYGVPVTLDRVPDAWVALADPRNLVRDATRLPEDVQPWLAHVRSVLP